MVSRFDMIYHSTRFRGETVVPQSTKTSTRPVGRSLPQVA